MPSKNSTAAAPKTLPAAPMSTPYTSSATPHYLPNTSLPSTSAPKVSPGASQFRRTASLRAPQKKRPSKPLLLTLPSMASTKPSTIQRGISVEGPVSSSFLKPEEYDELPVKCHTIISPKLAPQQSPKSSPRSSKERSPQREFSPKHKTSTGNYSVLKNDSLATFLRYEDEINCSGGGGGADLSPPCLNEKELKDKSNSLNRETLFKQSHPEIAKSRSISPSSPLKTDPARRLQNATLPSTAASTADYSSYVDPKLINSCDNLHITDKSPPAHRRSIVVDAINGNNEFETTAAPQLLQQRSAASVEKRSLKRHMKLNKENFLFDIESNVVVDNAAAAAGIKYDSAALPLQTKESGGGGVVDSIDAMFHDFDFEEFISSFDDDDKYPIFKGYKELMSSRSNIHHAKEAAAAAAASSMQLHDVGPLRIDVDDIRGGGDSSPREDDDDDEDDERFGHNNNNKINHRIRLNDDEDDDDDEDDGDGDESDYERLEKESLNEFYGNTTNNNNQISLFAMKRYGNGGNVGGAETAKSSADSAYSRLVRMKLCALFSSYLVYVLRWLI